MIPMTAGMGSSSSMTQRREPKNSSATTTVPSAATMTGPRPLVLFRIVHLSFLDLLHPLDESQQDA